MSALKEFAAGLGAAAVHTKDAVIDTARAISDSPGASPLHAFVRQGADELAQALTAFPAQAVQPVAEAGQLFEPTQAMVTSQITGRDIGFEMER